MDDLKWKQAEALNNEIAMYDNLDDIAAKRLRYHIGKAIAESCHPIWKCYTIPQKLCQIRKEHRNYSHFNPSVNEDSHSDNIEEELFRLKNILDELAFISNLRWSDKYYRIGYEMLRAMESPIKLLQFPVRIIRFLYSEKRKRKKKKSKKRIITPKLPYIEGIENTILFIATNGAGLGHLTRCLAIARRLKLKSPGLEIIFLTTSLALTTINREGFTAYCIPSITLIKQISSSQWNSMLKCTLKQLLQLYPFKAIIFDGAIPYASISATLASSAGLTKIWVKRGGEKSDEIADKREQAELQFDYIIQPGEAGAPIQNQDEKHRSIHPILYLDKEELWSREDVRTYLKIPKDVTAVYIQLGAGNINDIDSDINIIIQELRKHDNILMILGESMIGNEMKIVENDILIIKDYPNSKYFNGFDFAISACGYNSFHELLYFGVPTIFIPNMNTKTDDQYARAMIAQNAGAGLVLTDLRGGSLADAVTQFCDKSQNAAMRRRASGIISENGADTAATLILNYLDSNNAL